MRVLFATGRMLNPFFRGGDGTSIDQLLEGLQNTGIMCLACGSLNPKIEIYPIEEIVFVLQKKRIPFVVTSFGLTYKTAYNNFLIYGNNFINALYDIIEEFSPDIIITQLEDSEKIIQLASKANIPVILYVHDSEIENRRSLSQPGLSFVFYNSEFIKRHFFDFSGIPNKVVYPVFNDGKYLTMKNEANYITMINPTDNKGGRLVESICKELKTMQFQIVLGWSRQSLKDPKLTNIKIVDFTENMKEIYSSSKFVIIPSQGNEAFCRIPIEAGFSKTPSIASKTGGLPESVSNGGILINDYKNPRAWIDSICQLESNNALIVALGEKAFENAQRFTIKNNIVEITQTLQDVILKYLVR